MRFFEKCSLEVVFLASILLCSFLSLPSWADEGATLSGVAGVVRLNGKPAINGMKVKTGDVLTTEKGRVTILMKRVGLMQVGPGSQLKFDETVFKSKTESSRVSVEMQQGVARALIRSSTRPDRPQFKVKSGTATMGVRGTEVMVDRSQAEGSATFATIRGEAEVTQGSETRALRAGQGLRTGPGRLESVAVTEAFRQKVVSQIGGETREVKGVRDLTSAEGRPMERDRTPVDLSKVRRSRERLRDPTRDGAPRVRFTGTSRRTI